MDISELGDIREEVIEIVGQDFVDSINRNQANIAEVLTVLGTVLSFIEKEQEVPPGSLAPLLAGMGVILNMTEEEIEQRLAEEKGGTFRG